MGKASTPGTRKSSTTHFLPTDSKSGTKRAKRVRSTGCSRSDSPIGKAKARIMFGENIRHAREAAGLSQAEFAELCLTTQGYISAVELGKNNVSIDRISHFAKVLSVPIDSLLRPGFGPTTKGANQRLQARHNSHGTREQPVQVKGGWKPDG